MAKKADKPYAVQKPDAKKPNKYFNKKTIQYLKLAHKNQNKKEWFEKNKASYEENVKQPMEHLVHVLQKTIQTDLPGITVHTRSISRPLRPANRAQNGLVKNFISLHLSEKKTSLFEWNPGVYIHIGHKPEEHFLGLGLYMVSSRQMSLVRTRIAEDFSTFDEILSDKKFKKIWKGIAGDKMKKPPKGFPINQEYSDLLMHKQFYVVRPLTDADIMKKNFAETVAKELKVAMPFMKLIRATVGTYKRS